MERQSKESRGLEAHCRGGQGPPRAVAPSGRGGIGMHRDDFTFTLYEHGTTLVETQGSVSLRGAQ